MNSNSVKWAIIGMGALLAVMVIGVFAFNYFNQKVDVIDNTINAVSVMSVDGTTDYGIVYVDMGELVSTVTDTEFKSYFDQNKKTLNTGEYKYTSSVLNADGTTKDEELNTTIDLEDFAYGLQSKFSTDLKGKYTFEVSELIVTSDL